MNRRSQFRFLVRHFFDRFFDKDSIAANTDPRANVYSTIGLLAVPGLVLEFFIGLPPDFVVFYSMIVTGLIMVFKWDSLFPDRRDYLILGSLPIRYRDLFFAKVAALCLFLGIFTVSANFVATLMAPLGRNGTVWANLFGHLSGIYGGALFMALGFAAFQGILITILPSHLFRRVSPLIQMVSIAILLATFLTYPFIVANLVWLARNGSSAMERFPLLWFLGIYLLPNHSDPLIRRLALNALYGLFVVAAISLVTYAIAYRRYTRGVLDAVDSSPSGDDSWRIRLARRRDSVLLRHPVQCACFRFIGNILLRSSRHQVFLAVYLAVGLSLGVYSLISPTFEIVPNGVLALPLMLSFFVVSGLRAVFNIPHELEGNWIFRLTEACDSKGYVAATRKWVAVYGVVPLMLFVVTLEFAYWPWKDALFHIAFESMVCLILIQILFFNFRKVPFTCAVFPGKKNLAVLAGIYLYGLTTYRSSMVALELWLSVSSTRGLIFVIGGIVTLIVFSYARRRRPSSRLIYEEQSDTQIQVLGLNG